MRRQELGTRTQSGELNERAVVSIRNKELYRIGDKRKSDTSKVRGKGMTWEGGRNKVGAACASAARLPTSGLHLIHDVYSIDHDIKKYECKGKSWWKRDNKKR